MTHEEFSILAIKTHEDLSRDYSFLKDWVVNLDNGKRRAGVCKLNEKEICISKHHLENNSSAVVLDTLLHEFAHAIAYEIYAETGHGQKWKEFAILLGATPKATGRFKLPDTRWTLVSYCNKKQIIEKVAVRYRRNKNIKNFVIKGRPSTKGNLYYLTTHEFTKYELGELDIEQLNFVQ